MISTKYFDELHELNNSRFKKCKTFNKKLLEDIGLSKVEVGLVMYNFPIYLAAEYNNVPKFEILKRLNLHKGARRV